MYNGARVTFVYNVEFAWLTMRINHFHLGGWQEHDVRLPFSSWGL